MASPSKKAKTGEESYYKVIDGIKYARDLLEKAEGFAKDGQVSFAEANQLWESPNDGKGVTDIEKETLKYTLANFKYTDKAKTFLESQLNPAPESKSYYKQVDGVKYDRELLEKAETFAKDGQISYAEASELWEDAQDGKGVTDCERRTLEYTLANLKYTDKAKTFLESQLKPEAQSKSYYKQIDGVKYDRELLERAELFAKDGQISFAEAKELWEGAQDGKGLTDCERRTLEYTIANLKYTDKAKQFMQAQLNPDAGGEEQAAAEGKTSKSYYKVIAGVRYDRELLEMVEEATKSGGVVSDAEAHKIYESAQDGKGMTPTERTTLEYCLNSYKFTDKAAEFLRGKLEN